MTKKGMTVKELCKALTILIKQGDGDKTVTLSVTYDECDHHQDLRAISDDCRSWILLMGYEE